MEGAGQAITIRRVWAITWPMILSNMAAPVLGLVDTAVLGRMDSPVYLAAVALGAVVFNFIFWAFGFLRMGTTGLTAQAFGAGDHGEVRATLQRALIIGLIVGVLFIVLQWPIGFVAFSLLGGSVEVEGLADHYFRVRILGAPAALGLLVLMGWLIGIQKTRTALLLQVILNGANIGLDLLFVVGLGWGVAGVAAGTALSNYLALGVGLVLSGRILHASAGSGLLHRESLRRIFDRVRLVYTFRVNGDIMIRTILLVFAYTWFINEGALLGDTVLAANAVLMQFVMFAAFFLDGIAFSTETLVGEGIGRKSRQYMREAVRRTTLASGVSSLALSALFLVLGAGIIRLLTDIDEVRVTAMLYLPWVIATPIAGFWCWQLDGIFIGATESAAMRQASIYSFVVFMLAWWFLVPPFGNHGLWAMLTIYYVARAVALAVYYPGILGKIPEP